jgi:NADH-quinone oxidoreductase subunit J
MILQALIFYLFAFVAVGAGVMVISARNPVHSVLFLILAFFNAAGLFVLMGAEFLAMLLVVVYVGAVAVLFLFVVMMLDIDFVRLREGFLQYMPIGGLLGLVLLAELVVVVGGHFMASAVDATHGATPVALGPTVGDITNAEALGRVLYTDYVYIFQAAGLVLLVAMIGAIVLTLRHRDVRRQNIGDQVARRSKDTVELVKIPTGSGV